MAQADLKRATEEAKRISEHLGIPFQEARKMRRSIIAENGSIEQWLTVHETRKEENQTVRIVESASELLSRAGSAEKAKKVIDFLDEMNS